MDIIITDSALRKFLETSADSEVLRENLSLCGPTFDRVKKVDGDLVYEIEVITNRVDTASAQGVARDAAAILSRFNIPAKFINDPYQEAIKLRTGLPKQFHFHFIKDLITRFTAIALENISVKPSPKDTQKFLENCGQRSLNNCVDITNELTLLYGLPSHIFDLDKLAAQSLGVRESLPGEVITTLDDKKNTLKGGDIVIEDGTGRLVDLCGVMGGQIAEVDEHTKNILLIVPVYDPQKVRKTSLYLQKRTLAVQLYEKQPDPDLCLPVISLATKLFRERAGGEVSSDIYDYYPLTRPPKLITLNFAWLNSFIGFDIKRTDVISILADLGFTGTLDQDQLLCAVPSWRYHDINIKEDLAEEVARIYGYFRLPAVLPNVHIPAEKKDFLLTTELKAKKYLSHLGFHELYNSSLVSLDLLVKTAQDPSSHFKLKNALSTDYEYLRTSLIPSSLENHRHNQGHISPPLRTYEISNTYQRVSGQALPCETSTLALLSGESYRETKGKLETLLQYLKVKNIGFRPGQEALPFFDPLSTADILSEGHVIGHLGLLKPVVIRNLGLDSNPVALEINLVSLVAKIDQDYRYTPISEFPSVLEDITITSAKLLGEIIDTIKNTSTLIKEIHYLESFQDRHTFRVSFGSPEKNLDQKEINALKDVIQARFKV